MKTKILLVSNMFPSFRNPQFGTFVSNTYDGLVSIGCELDKAVIDLKTNSSIVKILLYFKFYLKLLYLCSFRKYDYIYVHFVSHCSPPILLMKTLGLRLNIVSHVHGGDVKLLSGRNKYFFKLKKYLSSKILSKSSTVIFPSSSYAKEIVDAYMLKGGNYIIYPSGGIDPNVFSFDNTKRNIKTIGYAGRLIKSKNVDLIIKSLLQLPDYSLEIVGDGQELTALTNLVKELNLEDVVRFLPAKSQQELAAWYQTIDCLVYPSESESLGLVPIEAMSCGVFCVLSDIPAFRELLDAQLNIELMRSLSPISISDSVKQLETWSEDLRFQNSIRVQELYSSEKVKKELLSVFQ
ncbi:glycosyl transferase [Vibrio cholerae]|nr:glycosyltransferase [Vibrio cholerae]GHY71414.1 glycosyl transferase [Vibrio cholerae]HDL9497917.1 glycosyltransferase family 4 protein [Vibrio cholerae]